MIGNLIVGLGVTLLISKPMRGKFERGEECRAILAWLENRQRLAALPQALDDIGRSDLAKLLRQMP